MVNEPITEVDMCAISVWCGAHHIDERPVINNICVLSAGGVTRSGSSRPPIRMENQNSVPRTAKRGRARHEPP